MTRSALTLFTLLLLSITAAHAGALRTYVDNRGGVHFSDRVTLQSETQSLFDESVLDAEPLVDFAPQAKADPAPQVASLAREAVENHPVKTVLIPVSAPTISYGDGPELYAGQSLMNPVLNNRTALDLDGLLRHYARKHGVPYPLAKAVAKAESNFNPRAVSPKGAQGIMQLMPQTAANLGVRNPFDLEQSIAGGVRYLKEQLNRFGNNVDLALAAYNAGPHAVERYQGVPPYRETRDYIRRVKSFARQFRQG